MSEQMVVGKYTLESLTNGMYSSPFDLYREYIQNSVDSIDSAIDKGIVLKDNAKIEIFIDTKNNTIKIADNGCGIAKDSATSTLIDIGNSNKSRNSTRGFRGIGRLAGLGYCDTLTFTTSAVGESCKTVVKYNAALLKDLLIPGNSNEKSIFEVIEAVVDIKIYPEKESNHFFEVELSNVDSSSKLTKYNDVKDYLIQHAPLPFSNDFKWGSVIDKKMELNGYVIPSYNISLNVDGNEETLFKSYCDCVISDRIKKVEDKINDIAVALLKNNDNETIAVAWYANTNCYGTILNKSQKGLRIRQGNILIGDNQTCGSLFKEERFNGWVLGEIHVLDNNLIANSRRDNFEKNEAYYSFENAVKDFTLVISKEIRHYSYARNLKKDKRVIVESDDENNLLTEDVFFTSDIDECSLIDAPESEIVAENDFFDKLSMLINKKNMQTKYNALNINDKLTSEQRKTLERVFDLISSNYSKKSADKFINIIASDF